MNNKVVGKARRHNNSIKDLYGITSERYYQIWKSQDFGCAICGSKKKRKGSSWQPVDHCHETGYVRGILCDGCNIGIGHFKENIEALKKAVAYLEDSIPKAKEYKEKKERLLAEHQDKINNVKPENYLSGRFIKP